jgi:hypothetical protein
MATRYRVFAYSQTTNQKQQMLDLQNDVMLENQQYAQQHADAYAARLNRQMMLRAVDWVGSVEPYEYARNPQQTGINPQ